jgi:hypothetical protein
MLLAGGRQVVCATGLQPCVVCAPTTPLPGVGSPKDGGDFGGDAACAAEYIERQA